MRFNFLTLAVIVIAITCGCSSNPKKAKIAADLGPSEIVEHVEALQSDAEKSHADLLYPKEYEDAGKYLDKVKDEANNSDVDLNKIRDNAGYAKNLYKKVISKSEKMDSKLDPIVSARDLALESGIKKYSELRKELKNVDEDFRKKSRDFKKELKPEDFADLQKKYLKLETAGIQKRNLSKAMSLIDAAKDKGAKSKAPESFDDALKSLKIAENMIASGSSDPERFKDSVNKARKDSVFLADVMDAILKSDAKLAENTARKLVKSQDKLKKQEERIAELEGHIESKDENKENKELISISNDHKFNSIISEVRHKFDDNQAEIFERDKSLVIRFKEKLFNKSGNDISKDSMKSLETLSSLLKETKPDEVIVEGHTDASADQSFSKALSGGQAEIVAKYFESHKVAKKIESKGKGSDDPIASDNTEEGRLKNQRIDIIVNWDN